MRYNIIIIILIILCVIITGCATGSNLNSPSDDKIVKVWTSDYISSTDDGRITKIFISEDNVTCYAFDNFYGGGISCIEGKI